MTVASGSFFATDRTRDPEAQFAEIRQKVVDSMHQTLDSAKHGWLFPTFLIEAIENQIWTRPRQLTHRVVPPMPLADFIKKPYPVGLGTSTDVIEKLIEGHETAMLAWEKETGRSCCPNTLAIPPDLLTRVQGVAPYMQATVSEYIIRAVQQVVEKDEYTLDHEVRPRMRRSAP